MEVQGAKTRGQLVLEKRSKTYIELQEQKKQEHKKCLMPGMVEVVFSVDNEKLNKAMLKGVAPHL